MYIVRKKIKHPIIIYRGTDTMFQGKSTVVLKIEESQDIEGCSASLRFCGVVKEFTEEQVATRSLEVMYSAEETDEFIPGKGYAYLTLTDGDGRKAVVYIYLFKVKLPTEPWESPEPPSEDTGCVTMEEVQQAIDDSLEGIGQRILTEEKVDVTTPEGETVQRTAQESMEDVAVLQKQVLDALETHAIVSIEDKDGDGQPDNETLRFTTTIEHR